MLNTAMMRCPLAAAFLLAAVRFVGAGDYPAPAESDYAIRDFKFTSGETLPELRIHYRTLGTADKDSQGKTTNAVLIMHGTTGSGAQFIRPEFAGELFGNGQPLDATKFFIVLPDGIGHGKSSKPSDGLRAKFPRYGYVDMVEAEYRLLTEGLGVSHARLITGTSMGGMHTWLWGESHPDFMDALMPLASLPTQISGRKSDRDSAERPDPRPWQPHRRCALEGRVGETARGVQKVIDFRFSRFFNRRMKSALIIFLIASSGLAQDFDVIIRNGDVYDG